MESSDSQVLYHVDNQRVALAGPGSRKCARFSSPILCEACNSSSQSAAFAQLKSLVSDAVCKGISATVLCFGQTGSGKTYTLCGPTPDLIAERQNDEERGVLLRSAEEVFHQAKVLSFGPCSRHRRVEVAMSVLEVYCEQPVDLLADSSLPTKPSSGAGSRGSLSGTALRVQMGSMGTMHVNGLTTKPVTSSAEVAQNLQLALSRRKTSPTLQNAESSRSHLLVTLDVAVSDLRTGQVAHSKVRLVDLAGSEHAKRSLANGERLQEASAINTSLSTLSRVITALVEKQRAAAGGGDAAGDSAPITGPSTSGAATASTRIPYRDSMLTRLLADSLGANNAPCRTAVILCLSPDASDYEQSRSTLEFGERARLVVNRAVEPAVTRMSLLPPSTAGLARAEAEATQYATVLRATAAENELLRQAVLSLGLDPAQLLATIGAGGRARGAQVMSRTGSLGSTFASVEAWLGQASPGGAGGGGVSVLKPNSTLGNTNNGHASALKPPTPTSKRVPSASTPSRPPSTPVPSVRGTPTMGTPRADVPAFMRGTASSSAKRSHSSDAAAGSVASSSARARSAPRGRTSSRSVKSISLSNPASSSRSRSTSSRGAGSHKGVEVDALHGRSRSASSGSRTKSALALEAVLSSRPSWDATSLPLSMVSHPVPAGLPAAAAPPRIALISPLGQVLDCNTAWQEAQARLEEHAPSAGEPEQPDVHQGPGPHMDAGAVADDFSDEEAREAAAPVEAELWPADTDEVEFSLPADGTAAPAPLPTSPTAASMHTGGTFSRHSSMASILSVEEVVVPWEEDEAAAADAPSTAPAPAQPLPSAPSFTSVGLPGRVSSPGLMFMSPVQAPHTATGSAASPLFLTGTAMDAATSPLLPASHPLPAVQYGQGQSVQPEEDPVLAEAIQALLTQTTDVNSLQRTLRAALAEVASLRVALRSAVSDNRVLATQLADGLLSSSPVSAPLPVSGVEDQRRWEGHAALPSPGSAMFASGIQSPANAAAAVQPSLFSPYASVAGSGTSKCEGVDGGVESMAAQMAVVQVELAAATSQCAILSSELEGEKVKRFQAEDLVSASEGWCSVLETQVKDLQLFLEEKQQRLLKADETVDTLRAQLHEAHLSMLDTSSLTAAYQARADQGEDEEAQDCGIIAEASEGIDCDVEVMESHLLQLSMDANEAEAALHAIQVQDLHDRWREAEAALHAAQAGMEGQAARAGMAETVLTLMVQKAPDGVHKLRARIDSLEQYALAVEKQLVESDEYARKLNAVFVAREAALAVQVQQVTAERDEAVASLHHVGEEASTQHAELYVQLQTTQESLVEYEFCAFLMRDWALRLLEELEAQDTEHAAEVEATHAEHQAMMEADIPAAVLCVMDAHVASIALHVEQEGALLQALADSLPTLEEGSTASIADQEEEECRSESLRLQDAVVSSVIALLRARAAQVAPLQATLAAQHMQMKDLMEDVGVWQAKAGQSSVEASHMRMMEAELHEARAQAKASDRLLIERATEMNKMQRKIVALQAASAVSARTSEAKVPLSLLQAAEAQLVDNRRLLEEAAVREADHEHRLAMYDQWAQAVGAPEPLHASDGAEDAEHVLVLSEGAMDAALARAEMAIHTIGIEHVALEALADGMESYEPLLRAMMHGQDELEGAHSDLLALFVAELSQSIETLRARSSITDAVLPILIGKSSAQITLLQTALQDAYGDIAAAQQKDLASQACIAALRRQQDALSQAIAEHLSDWTSYKAKIAQENKARQRYTEDVEQKASLYEGWCLQLLEPDMPLWEEDEHLSMDQHQGGEQGLDKDWTVEAEVLLARVDAGLLELDHTNAFLDQLSESCSTLFYAVDAVTPAQDASETEGVGTTGAHGEYHVQLMEAVIAALHARANASSAAHLEVLQMQRSAQSLITRLQQQLLATQAALLGAGRANPNPAYVSMVQDLQAQVDAANTRACNALQRAQTAESEVLSVRGALAAVEAVVEASSQGLRQQYAELKVLQAENDALKGRVSSTPLAVDGEDVDEDGEAAPPWAYAPSKEEQAQKVAKKLAKDMAAAHVQRVQAGWRATEAELRECSTQLQARLERAHREKAEALTELAKAKQGMKDLQAVVATAQAAAAADARARAGPVALPSTTPGKPYAAARGVSRAVPGEEGPLGALKQRVGKMVAFAAAGATPAKVSGRASGAGLHDVTTVTRQAVSAVKATPGQTTPAMMASLGASQVPTATPAKGVHASVHDGSPLTDSSPVTVSSDIDELDMTVATQSILAGRGPYSAPSLPVSRMGASAVGGGANDTVLGINGSMLLMSPALNLTGLGRSTARPTFDSPVRMFGSVPEEDEEDGAGVAPSMQSTQRGTRPLPAMTGQLLAAAMAVSPIDVATKQRFTSPPVLGMRSPSVYNLTSPAEGAKSKVAAVSTAKMNQSAVKLYTRAIAVEGRAMATNDENSPGLDLSNLV